MKVPNPYFPKAELGGAAPSEVLGSSVWKMRKTSPAARGKFSVFSARCGCCCCAAGSSMGKSRVWDGGILRVGVYSDPCALWLLFLWQTIFISKKSSCQPADRVALVRNTRNASLRRFGYSALNLSERPRQPWAHVWSVE